MPAPLAAAMARLAKMAANAAKSQKTANQVASKGRKGKKDTPIVGGKFGMMEIDVKQGERFAGLLMALGNPDRLVGVLGPILLDSIHRRFQIQGRDVFGWKARKVPSVGGILMDLQRGTSIKPRRYEQRPALIDTGYLRDSFDYEVSGSKINIVSSAPYAKDHQGGRVRKIKITQQMRQHLNKKRDPEFVKEFAWIFRTQEVTIKVNRRTIVAYTKKDQQAAENVITGILQRVTRQNLKSLVKQKTTGGKGKKDDSGYVPFQGWKNEGEAW